jgi:hypothetical protein
MNKAFTKNFVNGTFPSTGIYFLCKNASYKFTPKDSHEKITNDIHSVDWEVIECSHPELIVDNYVNAENISPITLGEATTLTFSNAKTNNEGFTWLRSKDLDTFEGCVLIHIKGKNSRDVKFIPNNSLTQIRARVMQSIAKFPNMAKAYELNSDSFIDRDFRSFPQKTIDVSKNVLFQDYPKTGGGIKVTQMEYEEELEPLPF